MHPQRTAAYDRIASDFDRLRPLPDDVPAKLRAAILAELPRHPRVLDLGCGSGRFGWPMVAASENYIAVDVSFGMLREFASRGGSPRLVRADGARLPFADEAFDAVLLIRVLSGTANWRGLLHEARRVARGGGTLFVGQIVVPEDGLDANMKQHLSEVLDGMGIHQHQQRSKADAFDWLSRHAERTSKVVARWPMRRTPRQFMERHGGGARFAALGDTAKTAAMARLANWASAMFGSLDAASDEDQSFVLQICRFRQEAIS
jgi:ubiquinone/menaquinone biosynthesis C-methylase UbiE